MMIQGYPFSAVRILGVFMFFIFLASVTGLVREADAGTLSPAYGLLSLAETAQSGAACTVKSRTSIMKKGNSNSGRLRKVKKGEKCSVISHPDKSRWINVRLTDGTEGWIPAVLIRIKKGAPPSPPPAAAPVIETQQDEEIITVGQMTHNTAIRSKPDMKIAKIRKVKKGEKGVLLARTENRKWAKMRFDSDSLEGWVAARLVRFSEKAVPMSEKEEEPAPEPEVKTGPDPSTLAVWTFRETDEIRESRLESANFALLEQIAQQSGRPVRPVASAWKMLSEAEALEICTHQDLDCQVKIGRKLGVEQAISAQLTLDVEDWVIDLSLINMESGSIQRHVNLATGTAADQFQSALSFTVASLFRKEEEKPLAAPVLVQPPPKKKEVTPKKKPKKKRKEAPPKQEKKSSLRTAGWATLGCGIGLAVLGGVSTGLAYKAAKDYDGGNRDAKDSNKIWSSVAIAGYAAGGALLTTGIILLAIEPDADKESTALLTPAFDGESVQLSLTGRW